MANTKGTKKQKITRAIRTKTRTKLTSLTIDVVDMTGKKKGTVSLPKELFGVVVNSALVAQAVRVYLANQRQSSAIAKTRGEVTGSRKKIWRQKGTGRARHGDRYASIFVGGGKAHGPRPRTFETTMPRSMKRKALAAALSAQYADNNIIVVDGLETVSGTTKSLMSALGKITKKVVYSKAVEKMLIATPGKIEKLFRAGKNAENITIRDAALLTTYDVANNRKIIFSKKALEMLSGQQTS